MSWLPILAALAATAATTTSTTADTAASDKETDAERIALQQERYNRVTVPVTIDGMGPFRFMVDTGAQATVVSTALADRLGLTERRQATLIGIASTAQIEVAEVPSLGLGTRQFSLPNAPLLEAGNIGGADGILGVDSLQDQRVLIDFHKQRILVADAKELGGDGGFEIVVKARRRLGQLIITGARINGVKTDVIVDTGSEGSLGNPALLDRMRRARALPDNTMTDVNGAQLNTLTRVCRSLDISGMSLTNVPLQFADSPTFAALGLEHEPALILGMSELRAFRRVAIDFSSHKVLFDLPRGAEHPDDTLLSLLNS